MHLRLLPLAILFLGPFPGLAFAQVSIRPLPPEFDFLVDLSHDGSIALGFEADDSDQSFTYFHPLLFDGAGTLTWLDIPAGFDTAQAKAMSADGQTIVGTVSSSWTFDLAPVRWDASGTATLVNTGNTFCYQVAISGDGEFAVGACDGKAARLPASGPPQLLDAFPAVDSSVASAVNADGSVIVGSWDNVVGVSRPFLWVEGSGMTSIPVPAPYTSGDADAVSDDGETVYGTFRRSNPSSQVIWRWTAAEGITILPTRGNVPGILRLSDVDASGGRVLGTDPTLGLGTAEGTIWRMDRPVQGLVEFLADRDPLPPNFTAHIISGDGHVFLGTYLNAAGTYVHATASEGWRAGIQTTTCVHGVANQSGYVARLRIDGITFAAANDITLMAEDLPPGAFTMFVASQTSVPPVIPQGSVGALCLGGSIGRYARPGEIQAADAVGVVTLELDLSTAPTPSGPTSVIAGQTWHYQGWHRDIAQGQATANFTNAVHLTYE